MSTPDTVKTPEPIGQQARWCEILEEFDFEIKHRPGRSHGNADAMSRRPCRQCGLGEDEAAGIQVRNLYFDKPADESRWNPSRLAEASERDPDVSEILKMKLTRDGRLVC